MTDVVGDRVQALACLGAAIAVGAPSTTLRWLGDEALASGADVGDIVGTFLAAAPIVGASRIVKATPDLAIVIGYDIDGALEDPRTAADGWQP